MFFFVAIFVDKFSRKIENNFSTHRQDNEFLDLCVRTPENGKII